MFLKSIATVSAALVIAACSDNTSNVHVAKGVATRAYEHDQRVTIANLEPMRVMFRENYRKGRWDEFKVTLSFGDTCELPSFDYPRRTSIVIIGIKDEAVLMRLTDPMFKPHSSNSQEMLYEKVPGAQNAYRSIDSCPNGAVFLTSMHIAKKMILALQEYEAAEIREREKRAIMSQKDAEARQIAEKARLEQQALVAELLKQEKRE